MRHHTVSLLMIALLVVTAANVAAVDKATPEETATSQAAPSRIDGLLSPVDLSVRPQGGPDLERWYFANLHEPHGTVLSRDVLDGIQREIKTVAHEKSGTRGAWQLEGPSGMAWSDGSTFSGRVLDLDIRNSETLRVASASGGFWTHESILFFLVPIPLTDNLSSQAIGSFSTDPWDEDFVLVGTGEMAVRGGTGMYLTDNGGETWFSISMSPQPSTFSRVRHDPDNPYVVHAATDIGYFRSSDRGVTWTRTLNTGPVSDLAINPWNTSTLYAAVWGDGIYRSENYGLTWTKLGGLPTANLQRAAIAIAPSLPSVIYVAFSRTSTVPAQHSTMLGVYRSWNAGDNWENVSPAANYMGGQGWYNNVLTVDPSDPNVVFAGGVKLMKSINGGTSWAEVHGPGIHPDYHALAWSSDGSHLYAGHDGGWSFSTDKGATWNSQANIMPITQYYNIDAFPTGEQVIGGGTQDNGIPLTTDGGEHWDMVIGGDGGGFIINPLNPYEMWFTVGFFAGDWLFERFHTLDAGGYITAINNGIVPSQQGFPQIRHDGDSTNMLFTTSEGVVYSSTNGGTNWGTYFGGAFSRFVTDLTVSPYNFLSGRAVYACLSGAVTGNRLWVADGSSGWSERSAGLPLGNGVRRVVPHPTIESRAYALVNGLGSPGQKVYLTINRGQFWNNITGNLPNVPVTDLVVHPNDNNRLFLSSEFGCFSSRNGGANWERWNNGLPEAAIVTDLTLMDLRSTTGELFIVAGTYGRSIWKRNIDDNDSVLFIDGFESGNTNAWEMPGR